MQKKKTIALKLELLRIYICEKAYNSQIFLTMDQIADNSWDS